MVFKNENLKGLGIRKADVTDISYHGQALRGGKAVFVDGLWADRGDRSPPPAHNPPHKKRLRAVARLRPAGRNIVGRRGGWAGGRCRRLK